MRQILIVTSMLALLGSACGGGSSNGGGAAGAGGGSGGKTIDACALATQADATTLFGNTATKTTGARTPDPNLLGECLWEWNAADGSSQLLQFHVWGSESYYSKPSSAQDYAIGERGYLDAAAAGVDIGWVQEGKTAVLAYSAIGASAPQASTKVEPLKTLAKKVEQGL